MFSSLLAFLLPQTAEAAHIRETLSLKKGWNGVYVEATPDVPSCDEFFKGLPVTKVMLYDGKGLDGAPLIDENGRDLLQPPIYHYVWNAEIPNATTLHSLVGGSCYLMYATDAVTKEFVGMPHPPRAYWRGANAEDAPLNLVGVSCDSDRKVTAKAYFGEGPYDGRDVYMVGGTDQSKPTMEQLFGTLPEVTNGVAYSLSASRGGPWSGVISIDGNDQMLVRNGSGALTIRNSGTQNRTVRLTMMRSAKSEEEFPPLVRVLPRTTIGAEPGCADVVANEGWDVLLTSNGTEKLTLKTVPSRMTAGAVYAAVLRIEDLGETAMRVRVPVAVLDNAPPENDYRGLWAGALALDEVSSIDGRKQPFPAAGIMALNVIVHVDSNRTSRLLQRAVVAVDANGNHVVYRDCEDIPDHRDVKCRMFTGLMSVDVPSVAETGGPGFGTTKGLVFSWSVPERARDNPFRHAWHPDHDGLSSDSASRTPTGDDPENYGSPIKPELWSVRNSLSLLFDRAYEPNADESVAGSVVWDVNGLVSTNTIRSTGRFLLRRIVRNSGIDGKYGDAGVECKPFAANGESGGGK